jgi:hypothetical protein
MGPLLGLLDRRCFPGSCPVINQSTVIMRGGQPTGIDRNPGLKLAPLSRRSRAIGGLSQSSDRTNLRS